MYSAVGLYKRVLRHLRGWIGKKLEEQDNRRVLTFQTYRPENLHNTIRSFLPLVTLSFDHSPHPRSGLAN